MSEIIAFFLIVFNNHLRNEACYANTLNFSFEQ